jgi:peptidoglycan hydrolase-like protein with peptidoglycan-binding domain
MKDRSIYLQQYALQALGFYKDKLDGAEGPITRAARAAWEASLVLSPTPNAIIARFLAAARKEVGTRETSKNQGPGIAKYWTATSYPKGYDNREPYCAAFVCWCLAQAVTGADHAFTLPRSALAYGFEKWATANKGKGVQLLNGGSVPKPGDIFTLSAVSHVGIVLSVSGSRMKTIEGNTDGSGSREGDGVYQRERTISSTRKLVRII